MGIRGDRMIPLLQVVSGGDETKSICLLGEGKKNYLFLPRAKLYKTHVREELLIRFSSEKETLDFFQKMINEKVPFVDAERTYAYVDTMEMIKQGKLHGVPVRSTWKDGVYTVHG
jgi:hypothetical protein